MSEDCFVLSGGLLVDGTGAAARHGDIAVRGAEIAAVGEPGALNHLTSDVRDVSGSIVAPGFVDIHSHADYTLLKDGRAHSALLQGVTSIVPGNCGSGVAPLTEESFDLAAMGSFGWDADEKNPPTWRSFSDYLSLLRDRGVAPNVFPLIAHGALRRTISGMSDRALDREEIKVLRDQVEGAMIAGAVGLSTGLEYAPGIAASTQEIIDVAEGMKEFSALYATHCRNRTNAMDRSAAESVEIAAASRSRLQMSHFIRRPNTPGEIARASWDILQNARADGMTIFADVFPFDYGPTPLSVLIPQSMRSDTRAEMAANLKDPLFKARVLQSIGGMFGAAIKNNLVGSMFVAADGGDGSLVGKSLAQIADKLSLEVVEAAYWLLENAGLNFAGVVVVDNWVTWNDLVEALEDDRFFIMSDGATGCLHETPHAMSLSDWGYAPRFLSYFVRDKNAKITLESAIHRMTLGPARQIGLKNRGALVSGYAADIVTFRMAEVGSNVAPDSLCHVPTGIQNVWVNGTEVVKNSVPTSARPGVVGISR